MDAGGAADTRGGHYSVALYRRGPAWDARRPLGGQPAVDDHVAYLEGLVARGCVSQAGPFHGPSDDVEGGLVGLVIFRAGAEEAGRLAGEDPTIRAGLMECEVLPWHP